MLNYNEADTFANSTTKMTYKINYNFNCSDKFLIYLSTCKKCLTNYIRKIVDGFGFGWNYYKSNSRNFFCNQPGMQRHLNEHCGFLEHVSITLVDKTDPLDILKTKDY